MDITNTKMEIFQRLFILLLFCALVSARNHTLTLNNDVRKYIALSTFGFYQGGILDVQLRNFRTDSENDTAMYGFSLDRTVNDAMNPYLNNHQERCILKQVITKQNGAEVLYFILDLKNKKLHVKCHEDAIVHIYKSRDEVQSLLETVVEQQQRRKRDKKSPCAAYNFDIIAKTVKGVNYYSTNFTISIASIEEEGLYNLYFHNCPNYDQGQEVSVDFTIQIVETNLSNFLSAGEMPLPALYCMMSILFLLSGMFWVFLLRQSKHPVFKIHYMMAVLVFLKAISLAFHGVNYHYIQYLGVHIATWAVLFYIAHLLKGALLFVVLVLIGTGWTFIKHVLAPKEKRLFMAVIPLQVLANVAEIILEESEEGTKEHLAWRRIFILVDLLCCGCILFPVVWSIRHLQEVSLTDDKAAMNLKKLKLFRHFYVMIVCYIYTTRMIVYLLKMAVPFQYEWLDEMFREMSTYVFFVLTAYKFRPASHNPYFAVSDEDDDLDQAITESGALEGLSRVNSRKNKVSLLNMTEVTEEEKDALLNQMESSHEYD
ncbi:protein GPR107 [Coccinella septempunctata]|uniref:protein GPR107 n=1 Tax=Coccinella septempunctata TaxID=41139 RepID=UPI001D069C34|nr:protein GPR107 [Coccinella septempunctata]